MRKFIECFVILFFIILFPVKVFALEVSWDDIKTEMLKYYENKSCTGSCPKIISSSNNVLKMSYFSDKYATILYSQILYDNNVIFLGERTSIPEVEITELEKVQYAYIDTTFIDVLLDVIFELEDVSADKISDDIYDKLGIVYEIEKISYTDTKNNMSYNEDFVKKFSINLIQFRKGVDELGLRDNDEVITTVEPSIDIKVGSKNDTEVSLVINVNDLDLKGDTVKATCNVYDKTNNDEKLLGTINCVEGENSYTISNLKAEESYSFYVKLNYQYTNSVGKDISGNSNSLLLDITTDASKSEVTNPKTGESFIYVLIGIFIISCIFIFVTQRKMFRQNVI